MITIIVFSKSSNPTCASTNYDNISDNNSNHHTHDSSNISNNNSNHNNTSSSNFNNCNTSNHNSNISDNDTNNINNDKNRNNDNNKNKNKHKTKKTKDTTVVIKTIIIRIIIGLRRGITNHLMARWGSPALPGSLSSDGVMIKIVVVIQPFTYQPFL